MDTYQITLVQQSFAQLAPDGDLLADLFYARLFQLEPALRGSFPNDLSDQKGQLLYALVRAVRDLPSYLPLGNQAQSQRMELVGSALLWTLEQGLGERFTPDVKEAWKAVYPHIAAALPMASGVR